VSTEVPPSPIRLTGPWTRGDFLLLLYWFADTNAVPEVRGIAGLSRLTRLALLLGEELGLKHTIDPYFEYHRTPSGGIASPEIWSELLALRRYQALITLPADDPTCRDLERALAALPEIHREVLLLVGVEGLDIKQAAAVLAIGHDAGRQRLARARAALAEALAEDEQISIERKVNR